MSGRVAKRLRSYLAALPTATRDRRTLSRLRRAWAAMPGYWRGRAAAASPTKAVGILMAVAPAYQGGAHYPVTFPSDKHLRRRGGSGLLKSFPRVGGRKRHRARGRRS